jgi:hypothetical protein
LAKRNQFHVAQANKVIPPRQITGYGPLRKGRASATKNPAHAGLFVDFIWLTACPRSTPPVVKAAIISILGRIYGTYRCIWVHALETYALTPSILAAGFSIGVCLKTLQGRSFSQDTPRTLGQPTWHSCSEFAGAPPRIGRTAVFP